MDSFNISGPFGIRETDSAPRQPGLYIWFARFRVGEADWNSTFAGGDESARLRLGQAVKEHSLKFGRQKMSVKVDSNFSSSWKGSLQEDYSTRWKVNQSEGGDGVGGLPDRYAAALGTDKMRGFIVSLLECGFPLFCPPLYIGKASDQTLQTRLKQHSSNFLDLWGRYVEDRQFIERLENPSNFSERAFKLGFSPEDLFCLTLFPTQDTVNELSSEEVSTLIEASEWLFNRWATPILGRQ